MQPFGAQRFDHGSFDCRLINWLIDWPVIYTGVSSNRVCHPDETKDPAGWSDHLFCSNLIKKGKIVFFVKRGYSWFVGVCFVYDSVA